MTLPPTLREGSQGNDVELAQYELCRDEILGGPPDVDGLFGPRTTQAVRDFQSGKSLAVDGVVGPQTWTAMLGDHPKPPTLKQGATGTPVVGLQHALNEVYPPATPPLAEDGQFGPRTQAAVSAYQSASDVPADGIVGFQTWVIHVGAAGAMLAGVAGV